MVQPRRLGECDCLDGLITTREAASRLRCSRQRVDQLLAAGVLKGCRQPRGIRPRLFIDPESVDERIADRRHELHRSPGSAKPPPGEGNAEDTDQSILAALGRAERELAQALGSALRAERERSAAADAHAAALATLSSALHAFAVTIRATYQMPAE